MHISVYMKVDISFIFILVSVVEESLVDLLPKIMKSESSDRVLLMDLRLFQSKHLASAKMLVRSIVERLVKAPFKSI